MISFSLVLNGESYISYVAKLLTPFDDVFFFLATYILYVLPYIYPRETSKKYTQVSYLNSKLSTGRQCCEIMF